MARKRDLIRAATPRGARSVQRILDAAADLFGTEGYQGASMNAVARAAGVSKGLLHYHFRSKEHLLIEAQRATFKRIHANFDERFNQGDRGLETALEAIDGLWDAVRDMRTWAPFMVETMSLKARPGPVRWHLDEFYSESTNLLERGIHRVFSEQLDQLVLPPDRLAWLVRTSLHGLVVELAYAREPSDMARIDQVYRDMRALLATVILKPE